MLRAEKVAGLGTSERSAGEVLAHSQDEGEWADEAEQIETRPAGTQVISARLPAALAEELLAEAAARSMRPSELVRQAVEGLLSHPRPVAGVSVSAGIRVRIFTPLPQQARTENCNLVVTTAADPGRIGAVAVPLPDDR